MKRGVLIGLIAVAAIAGLIALGLFLQSSGQSLAVNVPLTITHERVPYQVVASANKATVSPGEYARHRFAVKQGGKLVDLIGRTIFPHVAVVSDDLTDIDFYHVDRLASPRDGIYEFDHQFTAPSDYQLWFEINDNATEDHHGEKSDYIAQVVVPVAASAASSPAEVRAASQDGTYQLRLTSTSGRVGTPMTLRIEITDSRGTPVQVFEDYEQHFFFASQPSTDYYILDHFDETASTASSVAATFTPPVTGTYALWARVFLADDTGAAVDFLEGDFVIDVQ